MTSTVTIVIVTYNSGEHIGACLNAVSRLCYEPAPRVVVVDNNSRDESAAIVRQTMPAALLLPQPRNLGFAGGVNAGVAASESDIIALLNPDTLVDPDWLNALCKPLDDSRCGVVGSKILAADGQTLLHAGGSYSPSTLLTTHRGADERDRGQYDTPAEVEFLTGASLALRRTVWEEVGGFDPGFYPAYFEDLDLCLRLADRGFTCRYVPQSVLRHAESSSTGKYSGAFYYYNHRNRFRLACKRLPWPELWGGFCPAEASRLQQACTLDRLVAALVYRQSFPRGITPPNEAEQEEIVTMGRALAAVGEEQQHTPAAWSATVRELLGSQAVLRAHIAPFLAEAQQEAVLREHTFRSRVPLVAALRRFWNNIATRWYLLPVFHQQTRVNLALGRGVEQVVDYLERDSALLAAAVYQAALCARLAQQHPDPPDPPDP